MTTHEPITAIILAGGRSTRMQADKAQLLWRGRPFIEHIIERLQPQVETIAINCNDHVAYQHLGLPLISDSFTDRRGPLAGILAGLAYAETPLTLFVPCDNPMPAFDLVQRCIETLERTQSDVVYARTHDDNHYLHALMRTHLRDSAASFIQQGDFAVHRWYLTHRCHTVDFDDESAGFYNINRPEDLRQLPK